MIVLYRPANCHSGANIQAALQDMVIAHQVVVVETDCWPDVLPANIPLPALQDNGHLITGQAEIAAHLDQLAQFVADWRKFQSDACYLDDDGEPC